MCNFLGAYCSDFKIKTQFRGCCMYLCSVIPSEHLVVHTHMCLCVWETGRVWAVRAAAWQNVPCLQLERTDKGALANLVTVDEEVTSVSHQPAIRCIASMAVSRMDACAHTSATSVSDRAFLLCCLLMHRCSLEKRLWREGLCCKPVFFAVNSSVGAESQKSHCRKIWQSLFLSACALPRHSIHLLCLHPCKTTEKQRGNGW